MAVTCLLLRETASLFLLALVVNSLSPPAPEYGPPCRCPMPPSGERATCKCEGSSSYWAEISCGCNEDAENAECRCKVVPRFVPPPCPNVHAPLDPLDPRPPGGRPGGRPAPGGPPAGPPGGGPPGFGSDGAPGESPMVGRPGLIGRRPYPCQDTPSLPGPPASPPPRCSCL